MSTLRRDELSTQQRLDLDVFCQEQLARGSQPSGTFVALFEQEWTGPYQAVVEA
ncbi:hypothetical protein [Deinococcus sonorensis]|uniref:Uncharacterized protein n=2 Tax=Deinococcus sonorensis TaxID=309891 RepID=A0AAU7UG39_9DEIO